MDNRFTKLIVFAILFVLVGCGDKSEEVPPIISSPNPTPTPPGGDPPVVDENVPFALKLYTTYNGTKAPQYETFAETGTDTCKATDDAPVVTCSVTIDEGRLYYSDVGIQYGWMTNKCKLLIFQPYVYKASTNAAYLPPGKDATSDCSASPIPKECFGGAAPQLVQDFPKYYALIFLPDLSKVEGPQLHTDIIPSAYSLAYGSNRHTSNDLATAKRGTTFTAAQIQGPNGTTDGFIGGSMLDYTWICRDSWYDPQAYVITLKITDENTDNVSPGINNFGTWREAP